MSARHPLVGAVRSLAGPEGRRLGVCLAEGPHLVWEAAAAGLPIAAVVYTAAFAADAEGARCLLAAADTPQFAGFSRLPLTSRFTCAGPRAFAAMSEVRSPQGIMAVVALPGESVTRAGPQLRPWPWLPPDAGLALALDGIQDPGNVGALARALGAFAGEGAPLLIGAGTADPFSGQALRASAGAAFHLSAHFEGDLPAAIGRYRAAGWRWWVLEAHAGAPLLPTPGSLRPPIGFVVGGESRGPSPEVRAVCDALTIPTSGAVESLGVSQAGSIAMYAASCALRAAGLAQA